LAGGAPRASSTSVESIDINPYLSLQAKVLPFRLEIDISRSAA